LIRLPEGWEDLFSPLHTFSTQSCKQWNLTEKGGNLKEVKSDSEKV